MLHIVEFKEYKIATPVKVDEISTAAIGCSQRQFLIDGFTNGFRLGIENDYKLSNRKEKLSPSP